jgi:hypothetical protein
MFSIYKIVNDIDDEIYIGSTKNELRKRFHGHKRLAVKKPERNGLYQFVAENGWECCRIILIEEFVWENRNLQLKMEQQFIDLLKPKLNKNNAFGQKCEHNKQRKRCVECGGSQICSHDKRKSECIDCGGASICSHNKRRKSCIDCNNWLCEICDKKFASKQALKRHTAKFHAEKNETL